MFAKRAIICLKILSFKRDVLPTMNIIKVLFYYLYELYCYKLKEQYKKSILQYLCVLGTFKLIIRKFYSQIIRLQFLFFFSLGETSAFMQL